MQITVWLLRAVIALLVVKTIQNYLERQKNAIKAKAKGCGRIPAYPHPWWDVLGLVMVRNFHQSRIENKLYDACRNLIRHVSAHENRPVMTFMVEGMGASRLWTTDPRNMEALLSTQFKDFELSPVRVGNFVPLLGRGIFNTNGNEWSYHRALIRPGFTSAQISNLDMEETHAQNLIKSIPVGQAGWTKPQDLQINFLRWAMDSSTDFLFGESANSQLGQMPDAVPKTPKTPIDNPISEQAFTKAYDAAQQGLMDRFQFFDAYWIWNPPSFRKACRTCHEFIDYFVHLALQKKPADLEQSSSGKYIFINELLKETRDPLEIRAALTNILQAGRDSSSSLLGWTFFCLARHPEVFNRLRGEILASFGTDRRNLTFNSLKTCSYLQYCLNEALRLYPPVAFNATRTATKDTTLPKGGGPDGESPVFIPKGQGVDYCIFDTHRNPKFWDEDAEEFRPDRFEGRKLGWDFLPFNGGPRTCLGQQFAITSIGYTVVRMLQHFDKLENMDTREDVTYRANLTMRCGNGVHVRLRKAFVATVA